MNNVTLLFFLGVAGITAIIYGLEFLLTKAVSSWSEKRSIARILRGERADKPTSQLLRGFGIAFDSTGFSVRSVKEAAARISLRWHEIDKVTVFKRDLFTYDFICMFLAKADGTGLELDEELGGWDEFSNSLPLYLPGCQPLENWVMEVAFPAFETKATDIFRRDSHQTIKPA